MKYRAMRLYVRMVREKASPDYIARGWALGMFIGCLVPFGFQLILSVPLSIMLRASKIGAVVGTFITNPFTIFLIYPAQTWIADRLFFSGRLSYSHLCGLEWSFKAVVDLGAEAAKAFFVGGLLFALVFTPITYCAVLALVRRHHRLAAAAGTDKTRRPDGEKR